jgi:hypothetical protein
MQGASNTGLHITALPDQGQTLEQVVDRDLAEFEAYFCGELKNEGLSKPERAILKTYLFFKSVVEPKRESERAASRSAGDVPASGG